MSGFDEDEFDDGDSDRCESCGRPLVDDEKRRFNEDVIAWVKMHPTPLVLEDAIDEECPVPHDCDSCAVKRMRIQRQIRQSESFVHRAAQGGDEGWILAAGVFLVILLLLAMAS